MMEEEEKRNEEVRTITYLNDVILQKMKRKAKEREKWMKLVDMRNEIFIKCERRMEKKSRNQ